MYFLLLLIILMMIIVTVYMYMCEPWELWVRHPNLDSQAKQWPWEECEGIYEQSHLQKGVM
jgi:hypothetical protein